MVWCPGEERAGQACYLRRGATGPAGVRTSRLCGRPHASRGAALLELGGPLRGRGVGVGGQGLSLRIDLRLTRGTAWGGAAR